MSKPLLPGTVDFSQIALWNHEICLVGQGPSFNHCTGGPWQIVQSERLLGREFEGQEAPPILSLGA